MKKVISSRRENPVTDVTGTQTLFILPSLSRQETCMARRVEIWALLGVVGSVELRYLDSGYRFPSLVFADSEAL